VSAQATATDSEVDEKKKTEAEMIANMNQQLFCGWQGEGKSGSSHRRIIHILRILTTDRYSTVERMIKTPMISRKMDMTDRGVRPACRKGKVGGKILH
jgi:hypothetical protein